MARAAAMRRATSARSRPMTIGIMSERRMVLGSRPTSAQCAAQDLELLLEARDVDARHVPLVGELGDDAEGALLTPTAHHEAEPAMGRQRIDLRLQQRIVALLERHRLPGAEGADIAGAPSSRSSRSLSGGMGTPNIACSCSFQPAPMPRSRRPPDSVSSATAIFVRIAG